MKPLTEYAIAFGRIAATVLKGASNSILANLSLIEGEDGTEEGSTEEPLYGQIGFYVRPMPPTSAEDADGLNPEGAAEVVAVRYGDEVIPLAGRDLRCNASVNPSDGAMGIAHYGGGFVELAWNASKNGTVATLYALRKNPDGSPDKASVLTINSEASDASIIMLHESGQSITLGPDGQIILCNSGGDGYVEVKDSGEVTVNAASVTIVGGTVIGSAADPNVDPSIQELAKKTELNAWIGEVNTALGAADGQLKALGEAGLVAPLAVPEYTSQLKGV